MSEGPSVYTFRCGECGEAIEVDTPMRDALKDKGCVICGAPAHCSSFEAVPSGVSS